MMAACPFGRRAFLGCLAVIAGPAFAAVRLAAPFGDHMVLQRDRPVTVWGWAKPGAEITVEFSGQEVTTTTGADGAWRLRLANLAASAVSRDFRVSGDGAVVLRDVVVGDVWFCGGQSNMERPLAPKEDQRPIVGWEAAVASARQPLLRHLLVTQTRARIPADNVGAVWSVSTPETVRGFSAVAYFFARDLVDFLQYRVPVGLISCNWGGTPAEAWMGASVLADFPEFDDAREVLRQADPALARAHYEAALESWFRQYDPGTMAQPVPWWSPAVDDRPWPLMDLPAKWEERGHEKFDGVGWFRRHFTLPATWLGRDLVLHLSAIDNMDTTWVNGVQVGAGSGWRDQRTYRIPASAVHPGDNVVAVRVLDTGSSGGIWDRQKPLSIAPLGEETAAVSLGGDWSYRLVAELGKAPYPPEEILNTKRAPTVLFNGMVAPLVPFALRGFTFYQGESNADAPEIYRRLLPALIADWRRQWGDDQLPFLFVQIAPHLKQPPEIREAQLLAWKNTRQTSMVVTLDVGDPEDIHPVQKAPVGQRLALAARALAYGEKVEYSGPVYSRVDFLGRTAVLHFDHVGDGLTATGGKLIGFTLVDEAGRVQAAEAAIAGETVVVSIPDGVSVKAIRYAWANAPGGNLFNENGLPASPFRTDPPARP